MHFSSWRSSGGISLGAATALLSHGPRLPAPGPAPWFAEAGPSSTKWGDLGTRVQGDGCPSSQPGLPRGRTPPADSGQAEAQFTWSPWHRPRVWGRHSPKPPACLPPGARTRDPAGPGLPLGAWGRVRGQRGLQEHGPSWPVRPLPGYCWGRRPEPGVGKEPWGRSQEAAPPPAPGVSRVALGKPPNLSKRHTPYPEKGVTVLGQRYGVQGTK